MMAESLSWCSLWSYIDLLVGTRREIGLAC